jgi:glutamate-1-semialdehyde 2,1-aminomutase
MSKNADSIDQEYLARNPRSRALFERQRSLTPGGYTHLARQLAPFPPFVEENRGARKRDVDGHDYIDYWLGHGAMLLGHSHPVVVEALTRQAERGTHAGGETELTLEWAQLIKDMVPSAEQVRFVATGGEATQMAIRVARAHTGRSTLVKFEASFHGWHDAATVGVLPPYDVPTSAGVPRAVAETVIALPFNDIAALERALDEVGHDVAAVIMEPGGPFNDTVLSDPEFLQAVREVTTRRGVVLIFDEVVTGFRYALGGAQEHFGITPDLTALGKVMGGGLPVGAVAGRADVMEVLAWRPDDPEWQRFRMVPHPGTWNALPITAAAGIATLQVVRDDGAVDRARALTKRLIEGFNAVFAELGVSGFAYGRASIFKMCRGEAPPMVFGDFTTAREDAEQLLAGWGELTPLIRKAMLLEGVDLMRTGGFLSSAHTELDVDATSQAFERALVRLRRERYL